MAHRVHLAIVRREFVRALLGGTKQVETRFYRCRRPPIGRIAVGDIIHFKQSGGDLVGSAHVLYLKEVSNLTPRQLGTLRRRYGGRVQAPRSYWAGKRRCRFGVIIGLSAVVQPPVGLVVQRQFGSGWVVLGQG